VIRHIEFRAEAERWRVRVAETGFTRDEPNRMAYDGGGQIVSMGDPARDISTDQARVVRMYDAANFDPADTARCVDFFTKLSRDEGRRGLAHVLDLFDRYELTLELPGYEGIAAELRHAFEKHLDAMDPFVRSYTINGVNRKP
jgi:hypothetical protein